MEAVSPTKSETDAGSVAVRVVVIVRLLIGVARHDGDSSAAGHGQLAASREATFAVESDAAPAPHAAANIDRRAGRDGADHRETDAGPSPEVEGGFSGRRQGGCRPDGEHERRGCGEQC